MKLKVVSVSDMMRNRAVLRSPSVSSSRSSYSISSRTSLMSNGANLAPQLTRIDFAVLPDANCQEFFHHFSAFYTLHNGYCSICHTVQLSILDVVLNHAVQFSLQGFCVRGLEVQLCDVGNLSDLLTQNGSGIVFCRFGQYVSSFGQGRGQSSCLLLLVVCSYSVC